MGPRPPRRRPSALLAPHNGHLSLVPVALYKLLFATAGLEDYTPYRVMVVAAHLACVALLFAYARRRVGDPAALGAAVLLLVLGPAWQNILWPFQVGSLVSLAAGIGALLALDRGDRRGDLAAAALLALALASSGLGVVIALGIAVELLVARRRTAVWIAAAPLGLYAIWWIGYQDTDFIRHNVVLAPRFAADAAAGAMAALTGLTGPVTSDDGATLAWGRPLAVAAAALIAWRVSGLRPVPPRVARPAHHPARLLAPHRRAAGAHGHAGREPLLVRRRAVPAAAGYGAHPRRALVAPRRRRAGGGRRARGGGQPGRSARRRALPACPGRAGARGPRRAGDRAGTARAHRPELPRLPLPGAPRGCIP